MDQMDVKLSGVVTVTGDGRAKNDKFSLTMAAPIANGGRITLKAKPAFSPNCSADKNGVETNMTNFGDMHNVANLDNFDLTVAKSTEILGQKTDLTVSMERFGRGGANALTATTNVEQLGDVTVTLAKRGHKGSCPDDGQAISDDMCRVAVTLPMADINKDLSASVDYDVNGKGANIRAGYKNGDVTLALRTAVDTQSKKMAHTVNASYSGIEGVGIGLEVNDSGSGKLNITKDKYELEVPVSKSGVNKDDIKLTMKWSMEM
jgi:ribosome-associated translation inhibitor RaiA